MILRSSLLILFVLSCFPQTTYSQSNYKITLLRAAPGELLQLIDEVKKRTADYVKNDGDQPYTIRHSQGDQWDFMIYEHIGSQQEYFEKSALLYQMFTPVFGDSFYDLVAHHETIYSAGPNFIVVKNMFDSTGYYHVEMFNALPGRQAELLKQRQMENVDLEEIGRNPNLIFTVNEGANWDCFTLGGYRDIKHFAESADIPLEVEEKAAIKAGFKGVNDISPYLRSLIYRHHDTLGGKLK